MNPPDLTKLFTESAEKFTQFWKEFGTDSRGMESAEVPTPESMRKMRDEFLKKLSASYDDYLRSPSFTGQVKQMLQQGVQAQQRMTEMIGQARNAAQEPSRQDMDSLMEVMQRLERRITDGFERMDERINSLESAPSPKPQPAKKTAPTAASEKPASKTAKKKTTAKKP